MDESKLIAITRPCDGQSLCKTCYCMFGPMRKVPFRVRDCTDYLSRVLPTRAQMERIALIIPTEPIRKRVGFSGIGFAESLAEEDELAATE